MSDLNAAERYLLYEPGSFTLLRQLRAIEKPEPAPVQTLLDSVPESIVQESLQPMLTDLEVTRALLLAKFGLDADALREKLQPPATAITHIHLYHCNHLGTPLALIDPLGRVDWHIELDPWGNRIGEFNPINLYQPIRMQGQHLDEESGLFYNRYRYYDPGLGRYISRDPVGLLGGMNSYIYSGDPNYWFDPLGLQKISAGRRRTGVRQPALFDHQLPSAELNSQTAGMVQFPDYGSGGLVAGKKPWQSAAQQFSPYDYTQYCKKWSKANLSCTARDREPGRDVRVPSDYVPNESPWRTSHLPKNFICDSPYYFPESNDAGSAATADLSDMADVTGRILQGRRGVRR